MALSRNEDILNAILNDRDISELYVPQSREELLLLGILKKIHNGGGSIKDMIHICTSGEYDQLTRIPTIDSPDSNMLYFVPSSSTEVNNLFDEWVYANNDWERIAPVSFSAIKDVRINDVSVVDQDIANIPIATSYSFGAVRIGNGLDNNNGIISPYYARSSSIKQGFINYDVIVPSNQHESAFYGLARAAGDSTQSVSSNAVGKYTESAKSAISDMLCGSVVVEGTTPIINAKAGLRYTCGEVATIEIIPPENGIVYVAFESGSTPAVLTVPNTVKWSDGFDSENLNSNTVYEVQIRDGLYASATFWN